MELEHEKFETLKELSKLQTEVAATSALLETLKANTEEFYKEREGELRNRLQTVVVSAQALLTEANQYHDQFKQFLASTREVREKIMDTVTSLSSLREETLALAESFHRYCAQKESEFSDREKAIKNESESLKREQDYLNTQKEIISQDKVRIADERIALSKAKERLNI